MTQHTSKIILLENVSKVQLVVTPKREKQLRRVLAILSELRTNTDTHPIWGQLLEAGHKQISKRFNSHLQELLQMSFKRNPMLAVEEVPSTRCTQCSLPHESA